jgi:hypothetical protein
MDALYERAWTRFSREFRDFWTVGSGPHILGSLQKSKCVNCSLVRGWSRGGCRVWQEGVVAWINSTVAARWSSSVGVYAVATDETEAAHVLFSLSLDDQSFFVDSKGVWTPQELEIRLEHEYQYDDYWLKPWEQVDPRWCTIPFDSEIVCMIEEELFKIVGFFTPRYFFDIPDLATACS